MTYIHFSRLPVEIITEILSIAGTPAQLSHVNRWLRHMILTTSVLWKEITVCHPQHVKAVGPYLQRSGNSLLEVKLDLPYHDLMFSEAAAYHVVELFLPHFHRIREFMLARLGCQIDNSLMPFPQIAAPNLKLLYLGLAGHPDSASIQFPLQCPNLETIFLAANSAPDVGRFVDQTHSLRELHLRNNDHSTSMHVLGIIPILRLNALSLRELTLEDIHIPPDLDDVTIFPHLYSLVIVGGFAFRHILECITAPRLKKFILGLSPPSTYALQDVLSSISTFLEHHIDSLETLAILNNMQDVVLDFPRPLPMFSRLRNLSIEGRIDISSLGCCIRTLEDFAIVISVDTVWQDIISFLRPMAHSLQLLDFQIPDTGRSLVDWVIVSVALLRTLFRVLSIYDLVY